MGEIEQQLTEAKMKGCFQSIKVSEKDYLSQEELLSALNQLSGSAFDQETFEQLWDQCKLNSKAQVKVQDFISVLGAANEILRKKLDETQNEMIGLQFVKRSEQKDFKQQKSREDLTALKQLKKELKESLAFISQPFHQPFQNIYRSKSPRKTVQAQAQPNSANNKLSQHQFYKAPETLSRILWGVICLLLSAVLGGFLFNRFLDMTVSMIILVGYCQQTISRKVVKFNCIMVGIFLCFSSIWLAIYTSHYWNPSTNEDFACMNETYLRLSIVLIFLGQIIKIILLCYFLSLLQLDQGEVYSVNLFGKTLYLQDQKDSEIEKRPLAAILEIFQTTSETFHQ